MPGEGSVSRNIRDLERGASDAEAELFDRYFAQLAEIAIVRMKHVPGVRPAAMDPEIAAQSALRSVLQRIKAGREVRLRSREDLWVVLRSKLRNKIVDQIRRERAKKRGEGKVIDTITLTGKGERDENGDTLDVFSVAESPDLNPDEIILVTEFFARVMAVLPSDAHRRVACLLLEGYGNTEIGERIARSLSTVNLMVRVIRRRW